MPDYAINAYTTTWRYCSSCAKDTIHEIRSGHGLRVYLCVVCIHKRQTEELTRD